jgi:hypothetical protein
MAVLHKKGELIPLTVWEVFLFQHRSRCFVHCSVAVYGNAADAFRRSPRQTPWRASKRMAGKRDGKRYKAEVARKALLRLSALCTRE